MDKTQLNWNLIRWDDFESITIHLAQSYFKNHFFEKYLKSGNQQSGIDIRGIDPNTNLSLYLQCKHEKLSIGKLKDLVSVFINASNWERPCTFILVTTSNLQSKKFQTFIIEEQKRLTESGVNLMIWDNGFIEQELRRQYSLVHKYWGIETAKRHCLLPGLRLVDYPPFPNFIPREINSISTYNADQNIFNKSESDNISLTSLLIAKGDDAVHLCLVADAYEGKSIQLQQTAFEICNSKSGFTPLLINLKNSVVAPIEKLLEDTFDGWLTYPTNQLVIIIDGLDEVPSNQFIEFVTHLNSFSNQYRSIRLLFSCRRIFYSQYDLPKRLEHVKYYEIRQLSYKQTNSYLQETLNFRKAAFETEVHRFGIEQFLSHPFYLKLFTKWYTSGNGNMPTSKLEVVNRLIHESLDISGHRRLSKGQDLDKFRVKYKSLIKNFALALQMAGKNAFEQDEMQELFESSDLELLQSGSIISVVNKSWSFYNALYQEQLAAAALTNFPAERIVKMITIGKKIPKVRIKWLQTIASYLFLVPKENSSFDIVLQAIKQDSVELLTLVDASKFSNNFRLEVITQIFEKYIQLSGSPVFATDNLLASFINNAPDIIKYLLILLERSIPEQIKITVSRTLSHIKLSRKLATDYGNVAYRQLEHLTDPYYGELLINHLSNYRLGSEAVKQLILSRTELHNYNDFRDGIYKYLIAHSEVDSHFNFGLDGIPILLRNNRNTRHYGSEIGIQEFLLSSTNPDNIKRIFTIISRGDWLENQLDKGSEGSQFLNRLVDVAILAYKNDSSILETVVRFVISLGRRHLKEKFNAIDRFFYETKTNCIALSIYLNLDKERQFNWEFCSILTVDCFPSMMTLAEEGKLHKKELRSFVTGLKHIKRFSDAETLQLLIDHKYGEDKIEHDLVGEKWKLFQQVRYNNDCKYLLSREALIKGVIAYFKAFCKQELEDVELYLEAEDMPKLSKVDSKVLPDYLRRLKREFKPVFLKEALKLLENSEDFMYWRAKYILHFDFQGHPHDDILKGILKEYYNSNISKACFENAYYYDEEGTRTVLSLEYLLSEIWRKFQYETPDEILIEMSWMETGGVNGFQQGQLNNRYSLTELLIQHFLDRPLYLGNAIIKHLKMGISDHEVLASHIGFCQHLNLIDAGNHILDVIESERFDNHSQYLSIEVLFKLGGHHQDLLAYFESYSDFNNYVFLHLIKLLHKNFPKEVSLKLNPLLDKDDINIENKKVFAKYLAHCGEFTGFKYIIQYLEQNSAVPYSIQQEVTIWEVDTALGLKAVENVSHMLVNPSYDLEKFWDSPKHFILEILSGFAAKSEDDLLLVEEFLNRMADRFKEHFITKASQLRWHAEHLLDNFRKSHVKEFPITEIRRLIRNELTN